MKGNLVGLGGHSEGIFEEVRDCQGWEAVAFEEKRTPNKKNFMIYKVQNFFGER